MPYYNTDAYHFGEPDDNTVCTNKTMPEKQFETLKLDICKERGLDYYIKDSLREEMNK